MRVMFDRRRGAGLLIALVLVGCAGGPTARAPAPAQPLARLTLPPAASEDPLTLVIAGEFALTGGDLAAAAANYGRAAEHSPDPQIAAQATRLALAARQWSLAQAALARWQALAPEDRELVPLRAAVALHEGHEKEAHADLLRLARESDGQGWRVIGQALIDTQDRKRAADMLERLATADLLGRKVEVWIGVGQLAVRLGDQPLAQRLARQAVHDFGTAEAYLFAAQTHLAAGDQAGARALFTAGLEHHPRDRRLRNAYAAALSAAGDNAAAARLLAAGPQDEETYVARAAYAARADDKALLAALYREIEALPPPRSGARLHLLGELAELLERSAEALAWYRQVPGDDDHAADAKLRSALLLDTSGQTDEALGLLHQLQMRVGDEAKTLADAFLLEAEILHKHARNLEALAVYDRALNLLPEDTRLLYARALLYEDLDRIDAAVRDLRRVLELAPNDADALNALGYTLADRTDRQAEALSLIERALALKPNEPAIIDSLGWVQYRLGHLEEAEKQLRTAFARQPDAEIAAHLGEVLWMSGRKDEARAIWEQGRKKDAKNKVLLQTLERFQPCVGAGC